MKKIVVAVVVVVLALLVAPWGVGKVAEKRLNAGLDKLVEEAPYLKVVERKWTGGWFKSEQVVTFEAFGDLMELLNPEAIKDAMKKDAADANGDMEPGEPAVAAAPDAVPPSEAPADDGSVSEKMHDLMRFTVRNEILHGPVLGLSGFGIARVDTHLVLSEEVRKKIVEIFGPKDPLEVSTRVAFTGGGTTTFTSQGRTIKPDKKSELSWETFKLAIGYSRGADKYDLDGAMPKFEATNPEDKMHFVLKDLTLDGDGKRVRGDLYDGDFTFKVASMNVEGDGNQFEIADLHYIVESATKNDFTSMGAKLGSGAVKNPQLSGLGVELKEIHYDFSVRHLHTETLEKLLAGIKAMYAKPLTSTLEAEKVMFAPFKEQGAELLKYDPELSIDRIGIVTGDGDGYLTGLMTVKGATAEDFATGSMSLVGKLHADITLDVSEKMIQKFPNGSMGVAAGVDGGYLQRKGDRLICKILFDKGALTVNGKPQAIPGLGGPPPMDSPAEGPPPQE